MKRKDEIYIMWQIQENLLQHYRTMAATMLGLLCTAILVFTGKYYSEFKLINYTNDAYYVNGLGLILLAMLHCMSFWGCRAFQKICKHRAYLVTFFQNMLLAEESQTLDTLLNKHGLDKNVGLTSLVRNMSKNANPLPFERPKGNYVEFSAEISKKDEIYYRKGHKNKSVRSFLQVYFFILFYVLFTITLFLAIIFSLRYFLININIAISTGH